MVMFTSDGLFEVPIESRPDVYVIMKTMCPPGYHHNGFVATHALIYICMYMYIYVYMYIYIYTHTHTHQ